MYIKKGETNTGARME